MYDEDIPEPWVQCGACQDWFHQACALYNRFLDTASSSRSGSRSGEEAALPCFTCPLCRLGPEAARIPKPWVHRARDTNFNFKHEDEVTVSSSSLSSSQPASGVSFTLPSSSGDGLKHDDLITNDPNTTDESLSESEDREEGTEIRWDAPSLPTSHMTNFIEVNINVSFFFFFLVFCICKSYVFNIYFKYISFLDVHIVLSFYIYIYIFIMENYRKRFVSVCGRWVSRQWRVQFIFV